MSLTSTQLSACRADAASRTSRLKSGNERSPPSLTLLCAIYADLAESISVGKRLRGYIQAGWSKPTKEYKPFDDNPSWPYWRLLEGSP